MDQYRVTRHFDFALIRSPKSPASYSISSTKGAAFTVIQESDSFIKIVNPLPNWFELGAPVDLVARTEIDELPGSPTVYFFSGERLLGSSKGVEETLRGQGLHVWRHTFQWIDAPAGVHRITARLSTDDQAPRTEEFLIAIGDIGDHPIIFAEVSEREVQEGHKELVEFRITRRGDLSSGLEVSNARFWWKWTSRGKEDVALLAEYPLPPDFKVIFEPGQDSIVFPLRILEDDVDEADELVWLRLDNSGCPDPFDCYFIGSHSAELVMLDSLPTPTVSIRAVVPETIERVSDSPDPPQPGVFQVHRTGDTSSDLEILLTWDYAGSPTEANLGDIATDSPALWFGWHEFKVIILKGESTATFAISARDDSLRELPETVDVYLDDEHYSFFGNVTPLYNISPDFPSARVTIYDNGRAPKESVVEFNSNTLTTNLFEGSIRASRFRLTRSGDVAKPLVVFLDLSDSSTVQRDFLGREIPSAITFRRGSEFYSFLVQPIEDNVSEEPELIIASIVSDADDRYRVNESHGSAMLTVLDHDIAELGDSLPHPGLRSFSGPDWAISSTQRTASGAVILSLVYPDEGSAFVEYSTDLANWKHLRMLPESRIIDRLPLFLRDHSASFAPARYYRITEVRDEN